MTNRNDYNRQVIEEFRANGGKVSGPWEHTPLLLLTTTGAKSGDRRTTPMAYLPDGDRLFVWASNGGAPTYPDWYHNLMAHPEVTVEVGTETFDAIAVVTAETERDRLWTKAVERYPILAEHQAKITLYWLLGSSVQKQARPDGERSSFPACKHRLVGVLSDVVNSRLMLEQCYFHVMEKLLLWLVFLPLSSASWRRSPRALLVGPNR